MTIKTRKSIYLITLMGTAIFLLLFITKDALRLRNLLEPYKAEEKAETAAFSTSKVENATNTTQDPKETVCKYVDILHEEISEINPNDNIQQVIGYQNNKVGLYIYAEVKEFTEKAAKLVNSNGGDWGYVLVPYNVKDYNKTRWESLFNRLTEKHLIPIIQLWDIDLANIQERDRQIQKSAEFLNSLKWPIKNRYISAYNEPNDANFWKGKINPAEYAEVLEKTINTFKVLNKNFFMLNGAFNASARTGRHYLDEEIYLIKMNNRIPGIFKRLDGWASHPYPQPNFSGSPQATGRDSIRAYEWELKILRNRFGVDTSKLPIFITETGWAHKESETYSNNKNLKYQLNQYQVADNIRYAFEKVWLPDKRVAAVTLFTIRYNSPYGNFSWITTKGNPYPQFTAVRDIRKTEGKPPVVTYYRSKILECE